MFLSRFLEKVGYWKVAGLLTAICFVLVALARYSEAKRSVWDQPFSWLVGNFAGLFFSPVTEPTMRPGPLLSEQQWVYIASVVVVLLASLSLLLAYRGKQALEPSQPLAIVGTFACLAVLFVSPVLAFLLVIVCSVVYVRAVKT